MTTICNEALGYNASLRVMKMVKMYDLPESLRPLHATGESVLNQERMPK